MTAPLLPPAAPSLLDQLLDAISTGDLESAKSLLAQGADPMGKSTSFQEQFIPGITALIVAAARNQPDMVELLLPVADALYVDSEGDTALICAAWHGHLRCAELLLPFSDIGAKDWEGMDAMAIATARGFREVALAIGAEMARRESLDLAAASLPAPRAAKRPPL